jgi:hypothetical protein
MPPTPTVTTREVRMIGRAFAVAALVASALASALVAQAAPAQSAPSQLANLVGKWEIAVETPQAANTMTVTFERVDGALKGRGESQYGVMPVSSATVAGNDVAFVLVFSGSGQSFDITFTGKVAGDAGEGTLTFPMEGAQQSGRWKAKRLPS